MNSNPEPSVSQIINAMPERFNAEAAGSLDAVLQFCLKGEEGGDWFATIKDGYCTIEAGRHPEPTLSLFMSAKTYVAMAKGETTGQQAFFKRQLRFEGPIALAGRLHRFFRPAHF